VIRVYTLSVAVAVRKLDLEVGEMIEVAGRRYEVVPDREGGLVLEQTITPVADLDARRGTQAASAEDFDRIAAEFPLDDEG
jgi:hypothetical protein